MALKLKDKNLAKLISHLNDFNTKTSVMRSLADIRGDGLSRTYKHFPKFEPLFKFLTCNVSNYVTAYMSKELFEFSGLISTEMSIQEILTYTQTLESVSLPNYLTEFLNKPETKTCCLW